MLAYLLRAVLATLLACCLPVQAATWDVRVVRVLDGDTLVVTHGGRRVSVRLVDIDAPESDQPWGRASRRSLQQLVRGHELRLTTHGRDRYRRVLGSATRVPDGLDVNLEQVRRGMAWASSRSRNRRAFDTAQAMARAERRGLWADRRPVPPAEWRRMHRPPRDAARAP